MPDGSGRQQGRGRQLDMEVRNPLGMVFEIEFEGGVFERLDDMALAHGQPEFDLFVRDLAVQALEKWEAEQAEAHQAAD